MDQQRIPHSGKLDRKKIGELKTDSKKLRYKPPTLHFKIQRFAELTQNEEEKKARYMARSMAFKRELGLLKSKMGQMSKAFVDEQCTNEEQWTSTISKERELDARSAENEHGKEKSKVNAISA